MDGYLTPGEKQALRAGAFTWIAQEFGQEGFASLANYAGYPPMAAFCDGCGSNLTISEPHDAACSINPGPDSPLGYDGSDDDSTDMRDRG